VFPLECASSMSKPLVPSSFFSAGDSSLTGYRWMRNWKSMTSHTATLSGHCCTTFDRTETDMTWRILMRSLA
jgi:hypothetical protein